MRIMPLVLITVAITLSGCTLHAPQYEASMSNVQKLKRNGKAKIKLGAFVEQKGLESKLNGLTFRGSSFLSPTNGSYAQYIKAAIKKELFLAKRLNDNAKIDISSVLLKNEFDGSGINVGLSSISAKFVVRKNGKVKFSKVISVDHKWESYFAAFSALPAAQQGYVNMIQKFIGKLFSDKDFIRAIS